MCKIVIISDVAETLYEMLAKARELVTAEEKIAAFVNGDEKTAQDAVGYGADIVKLLTMPRETAWESYSADLQQEITALQPELIMVGATRRGKDLAAQLAARLDIPCVTECKNLQYTEGRLVMQRIVYGGLAEKELEGTKFPVLVTIASRTFAKWSAKDAARTGEISQLALAADSKIKVVERRPKPAETVNIKDAQIVIGAGRGFTEKDQLNIAEELAGVLGGVVACSRPIAEDLHWLPEDRYIGISGQVIKPGVYIAAGISGQVQHVYGIRDAKTIVAIDKNENAPIFQVADYYIVGDLQEILPALTNAAREVKGS
ncbi:MAG: electron transfer flavoprotein subunit alpha/FixB family protein [Peptococcaceae bacterium]